MSQPHLQPPEAHALAELIYAVLPAAFCRGVGTPLPAADRDRILARLDTWAATLPVHPTELLSLADRLARAGHPATPCWEVPHSVPGARSAQASR